MHLQWSVHTSTRAAQKILSDWEQQCVDAFMHIAYNIKLFTIPPELVINADQTRVCLIPAGDKTWAPTGSKQVTTMAKEEKQQFSLMVATSAAGEVIPFQAIHKGKTMSSLPSFESCAKGESMGSSGPLEVLPTGAFKACHFLPQWQKSILIIDIWSVHRSKEFTGWMKGNHPDIKINYIPGGCTGKFQPAM
ncbi:hypothetical protein BS47DRAFT_1373856 [Hydnum rufescens UP504]|uniref:DDE-1 domain-containing protein n=1 Tax=Hydnum rufescens UP504 TaxID=1448309 RepID=A0A9P6DN41_9AGAM|nr:hypothetical protein BS47DRAFT_1373856 [Hydnum rufescens UP504]